MSSTRPKMSSSSQNMCSASPRTVTPSPLCRCNNKTGANNNPNKNETIKCSKLDLLSIVMPRPGKVCISSKYNSSCCPFPRGLIKYPVCSWFASPRYFYSCWKVRHRCCGVKCLYSDESKHCCTNNNVGTELGPKISTNTLHGVQSVNDLRAWSLCCEDRKRYFKDMMLIVSHPGRESGEHDSADQGFLDSGASAVEAKYESLLSRKDDEIERLKQELLALKGVKSKPKQKAEVAETDQKPSRSGSQSSSEDAANMDQAAHRSTPPPSSENAAEMDQEVSGSTAGSSAEGAADMDQTELGSRMSGPSSEDAVETDQTELGSRPRSSSEDSEGIDKVASPSSRDSGMGSESSARSSKASIAPSHGPSSQSLRSKHSSRKLKKDPATPEPTEEEMWNSLFGIPEEDENTENERREQEYERSNSFEDDQLSQENEPGSSGENSFGDDAQLPQGGEPGTSSSNSPVDDQLAQRSEPGTSRSNSSGDNQLLQGSGPGTSPGDDQLSQGSEPGTSRKNSGDDPLSQGSTPGSSSGNSPVDDSLSQGSKPGMSGPNASGDDSSPGSKPGTSGPNASGDNPSPGSKPGTSGPNASGDDSSPDKRNSYSPAGDEFPSPPPGKSDKDSKAPGVVEAAPTNNKSKRNAHEPLSEFSFSFGDKSKGHPGMMELVKVDEDGKIVGRIDAGDNLNLATFCDDDGNCYAAIDTDGEHEEIDLDDDDPELTFELPPGTTLPGQFNNGQDDEMRRAQDMIRQMEQLIVQLKARIMELERNSVGGFGDTGGQVKR